MSLDQNALGSIARQLLTDKDGRIASLDRATWAQNIISYEHHEIHAGSHFNICDYDVGLGSGVEIEFIVTTPDTTKLAHLTFSIFSSTGARVDIYEGASGITGGNAVIPRNNNRSSTNTSVMTVVKDPSAITSDGTFAAGYLAGAGRTAGFANRENEYVLKQNETYLLRITTTASSNNVSWCFEWYEHTDKV